MIMTRTTAKTTIVSFALLLLARIHQHLVAGYTTTPPVSQLLTKHANVISKLKNEVTVNNNNDNELLVFNDVFFLRYCLDHEDDEDAAIAALKETLKWRNGERGKVICDSASKAVTQAMSDTNTKWNNTIVRDMAPHAHIINKYITPSQILTTSSNNNDLVYCIRAGQINDIELMSKVSVDEMSEFFLYCKEVNAIVANKRSLDMNQLLKVITANDLSGTSLLGDASFRKALSAASKAANSVYPSSISGPSLLLNLPALLGALVKLFKPLFPKTVQSKIKFEQGPLKDVQDLTDILQGSSSSSSSDGGNARSLFLSQIDHLVYDR